MAYIGNDVDAIFLPESVNTSTKLRISDGDGVALIGDITTGTSTTDSGIMFDFGTAGAIKGALFTEVDGEILSYGINVAQIDSAYDNTRTGGIFRLDTRPAAGNGIDNFDGHCFVIKGRKEGELETEYNAFGINFSDGNTILVPENGNVGIGITSVSSKLDVDGDVNVASGSNYLINGTQISTANVTENASYLYYTDTRSRNAISVTDNGGDGSLSYDSGTGAITYVGPSAAETRAHFSAGTGVSITNGEVAIGQSVGTSDNVTFVNGIFSGNVGIGTTNPTSRLHVDGDAKIGFLDIYNSGQTIARSNGQIQLIGGGGQSTRNNITLTNNNGIIIDGGSGETYGVEIKGGGGPVKFTQGNVGIGTANPTVKLEVIGTIKATTYADLPTSLTVLSRSGSGVVINAPTATLTCLDRAGTEVSVMF